MEKEIEEKYCEKCGTKLYFDIVSAERYGFPKYNEKTGKENLMKKYRCPSGWYIGFWGRKKYNKEHSNFGIRHNF